MVAKRIFAVINQKGGSTKTTTTVNLAAALVARGRTVRVTDLDPQEGSLTHWLPPTMDVGAGLLDVFEDKATLDEVTSTTTVPNLYVVPSYESLRTVEMTRTAGSELVMRNAVRASTAPVDFDFFDCPHSKDILAISGIAGCTDIIIPTQASSLDIVGMGALLDLAGTVKKRLNPTLDIAAIVVGRTKGRSSFDLQLLSDLRSDYPTAVVMGVRDTVQMRRATNAHQPIDIFEPGGGSTEDFAALAKAIDELPARVVAA